ncbi:hypothetical protein KJ359_005104 [Pestalotiopsis sp. 9143b]|nr:hypothetical protein KJ359_005104 [Pestalotiopsis sp. 9143b]
MDQRGVTSEQSMRATGQHKTSRRASRSSAVPRSKRAKYTAIACDECKRRKLKCVQEPGQAQCNRCKSKEVECSLKDEDVRDLEPQPIDDRQASLAAAGVKERKEVQFVGTTRPAYALNVAKATLSVVDESSDHSGTEDDDSIPLEQSPIDARDLPQDPLLAMSLSTIYRLLDIFRDEVEPVYPLLETSNLRSQTPEMLKHFEQEYSLPFDGRISQKDIHLLKIVLATALVLDNHEKTELSARLISSFEDDALRITSPSDVDLQEAQIFAIMSIYHFHCDEELLAYRSIGISTRMVLELGLHRRRSLEENYRDPAHRALAIRVFWCIYVLDRRWSFGTGLSFALFDRDLNPPEPSPDMPYFCCLVAYGKLCSKVWEAIPHYGSSHESMASNMESSLESDIQTWFSTIPDDTQLARADASPSSHTISHNAALFRHLQTLLYLRGNYIRCLIHRHHVVSPVAIMKSPVNARLVVSIAQDTIRILVTLNNTSDIYSNHQVAYNYFLISAISILLLAVCHAPAEFAQNCRQDFSTAINLVRGFSRISLQGRRLWRTIRGLVVRLKQVGIIDASSTPHERVLRRARRNSQPAAEHSDHSLDPSSQMRNDVSQNNAATNITGQDERGMLESVNFQTTVPDTNMMGDDLMGVFDTFSAAYMENSINAPVQPAASQFDDSLAFLNQDVNDFSEYFMGLI